MVKSSHLLRRVLVWTLLALPLLGCNLFTLLGSQFVASTAPPDTPQVELGLPSPTTPGQSPATRAPSATPLPTNTPAPTETPTPTFTPEPTHTPAPTATTAPGTLWSEAANLCAAAETLYVQGGSITGPYLSLFKVSYELSSWEYRPTAFQEASSAEAVANVVCILQTRSQEGKYEDGEVGYRLVWETRVLSWPDGQVLAAKKLTGDKPPAIKFGSGPGYGLPPARETARYLAELTGRQNFWVSNNAILDLTFTPQGRFLLVGEAKPRTARWSGTYTSKVQVWEMARSGIASALSGLGAVDKVIEVVALAVSPDGRLVAASGNDMSILVWNLNTGEVVRTLRGHTLIPESLAFSPDSQYLASADEETVRMWNLTSGSMVWEKGLRLAQPRLVFDPQSGLLAVGTPYARQPATAFLDPQTGEASPRKAWTGAVLGFSTDGALSLEIDGFEISLLDTQSGQGPSVRHHLASVPAEDAHSLKSNLIAVAAGLSRVAYRNQAGNIEVCQMVESPFCRGISVDANIWALALSPDGRYLAVGTEEGIVNVFDLDGE